MKKAGILAVAFLAGTAMAFAQGKSFEQIVPAGAEVQKVAGDYKFTEGPAWDYKEALYFSDIPASNIIRVAAGQRTVWRENSGGANGLMCDAKRRMVACEGAARRVSRQVDDSKWETVADKYKDKKLNSPNDLAIDTKGKIYFTDPRYGKGDPMEQDKEAVYVVDTNGKVTRIIDDTKKCNGIAISPDEKTLYVVDNGAGELRAYPLNFDGTVDRGKTIAQTPQGDGMCVDADGGMYVACTEGVYVLDKNGKQLGIIKVPEQPSNCVFGGANLQTLYITAKTSLYKIRLSSRGWQVQLDGVKK